MFSRRSRTVPLPRFPSTDRAYYVQIFFLHPSPFNAEPTTSSPPIIPQRCLKLKLGRREDDSTNTLHQLSCIHVEQWCCTICKDMGVANDERPDWDRCSLYYCTAALLFRSQVCRNQYSNIAFAMLDLKTAEERRNREFQRAHTCSCKSHCGIIPTFLWHFQWTWGTMHRVVEFQFLTKSCLGSSSWQISPASGEPRHHTRLEQVASGIFTLHGWRHSLWISPP